MSTVIRQIKSNLANNIRIEIIEDDEAFDALEPDWRELFEVAGNATIFLKWEWLREWWRIFKDEYSEPNGKLHIIALKRSQQLIGLLPLYIQARGGLSIRTLRFISTCENSHESTLPEYLNLLCRNVDADCCMEAVADHIFSGFAREWDEFNLGIQAPQSLLLGLTVKPLRSIPMLLQQIKHTAYLADISKGFEEYLKLLPSNARQHFKKLLKQANLNGFEFTLAASPHEASNYFDDLIKLHQNRWNKAGMPGAFSSQRIVRFHQALIKLLSEKHEVLLSKLSFEGVTIGVLYGFITKGKFDFYQSGIDIEQVHVKSPGILAHLLTIQHLSDRRIPSGETVHTYDFLTGETAYKERFATSKRELSEINFFRLTVRTAIAKAINACARISRKFKNLTRSHGH